MKLDTLLAYVSRFLKWLFSTGDRLSTFLAVSRDAKLKRYACSLTWVDGDKPHMLNMDVKAENEADARRLANEGAIKQFPVLKPIGSHTDLIPPYSKDAAATLALWRVEETPLTDADHDLISQGKFGPAGSSGGGFS